MGLELVYFAGSFILLIAIIYGTLSYRYRDRSKDRQTEEATRQLYRDEDAAGSKSRPLIVRSAPRVAEPNGVEPSFSEDDIQRSHFGPRGVLGAQDPARMTPQRAKKTPSSIDHPSAIPTP
jgi:hypothetical protein